MKIKVMKRLTILIAIFTGFGFGYFETDEDCIKDYFEETAVQFTGKYNKTETQNEYGVRHTIDSLNFSIIRRWKENGTPIMESLINNLTDIERWKQYHDNGNLMKAGFMTVGSHTEIGIWRYYSIEGELESSVNYDELYSMSFCDFIEIAEGMGFYDETSDICFDIDKNEWTIIQWTSFDNHSEGKGITVNSITKEITEETVSARH